MLELLILTFFASLPVMFALSLTEGFDVNFSRIFVLAIFFVYLVLGLYRGKLFFPKGSVIFIATTLFSWALCSLLYSEVITWTARKIFFLITFAPLCIVCVWYMMQNSCNQKKLIKALVVGGSIGSIIALIQFILQFIIGLKNLEQLWNILTPFFLGGTFSQSVSAFNSWFVHVGGRDLFRAIGFFPDPHVFAFYTGMIVPFAFGLYLKNRHTTWIVVALTILVANLLSFSRGGQMGLIGGALIAIVLSWPHITQIKKHIVTSIIVVLILVAMIPGNALTERFTSSFSPGDTSNTSRIEIWTQSLDLIAQSPIIGVGFGAYAFAVDPKATYRTPAYAHNIFLDIGVELGLVGLILFSVLVLRMLWLFFERGSVYSYCAIISMGIFLTHGFFDTPFFSVHVFPVILFLIALATYYESTPQKNQKYFLRTRSKKYSTEKPTKTSSN